MDNLIGIGLLIVLLGITGAAWLLLSHLMTAYHTKRRP